MKLIRFGERGSEKAGVWINDRRLDLSSEFRDWDSAFFFRAGLESLGVLLRTRSLESFPQVPQSTRWGAPIARPGKIVCIGLNFHDHVSKCSPLTRQIGLWKNAAKSQGSMKGHEGEAMTYYWGTPQEHRNNWYSSTTEVLIHCPNSVFLFTIRDSIGDNNR